MGVFLKVFLVIMLSQLSYAQDYINDEDYIPDYIRDLIKDFNEKDSNIHDVVLIDLESEKSSDYISRIIMKIPNENPVMIPSIDAISDDRKIRPASFIIITADTFKAVDLFMKARFCIESNYYHNTAKFIFIGTEPMTDDDLMEVCLLLSHLKVNNNVILNINRNGLEIISFNPYSKNEIVSFNYITDVDYVFRDKLIDLNGFTYKALLYPQTPRLYLSQDGDFHGIDIKFMQTVAKKQNANFNITIWIESHDEAEFFKFYYHAMTSMSVDLTINTATKEVDEYALKIFKTVNTFDVNGHCALIPYPERVSFLGLMVKPYDFYTWIVFMISFGICVFIWKMFNLIGNGREDSALYFMFGIIAHFLLQSIPFRNNRIIQKSLLQICIFMTFILGNAYQSLIISLISEPRYGATIKSFDELMQSNYSLKVDPVFYYMMNLTDDITMKKIRKMDTFINNLNYQEEAGNNTAIVLPCDVAEYIMFSDEFNSNAIDYFYLLQDQIYSTYESFPLSQYSPFHEKLQYFSTLIFESGIRQYWKDFDKYVDIRGKMERKNINNEEYLIDFHDLIGVFYLLGFGFGCAILALIFEIFWHDCLRHLTPEMIVKFMMRKNDENKMKVRRIQVKPVENTSV